MPKEPESTLVPSCSFSLSVGMGAAKAATHPRMVVVKISRRHDQDRDDGEKNNNNNDNFTLFSCFKMIGRRCRRITRVGLPLVSFPPRVQTTLDFCAKGV